MLPPDVEELTGKAGGSKPYPVFLRMLAAALRQESRAVSLDLLTPAELGKLGPSLWGKPRAGGASPVLPAAASPPSTRYLVLTSSSDFETVLYPLQLAYEETPDPARLKSIIKSLRLGAPQPRGSTSPGGQGQQPAHGGHQADHKVHAMTDFKTVRRRRLDSTLDGQESMQYTITSCSLAPCPADAAGERRPAGARDRGRPVGAIGDVGCFSFCQDKIISTGGGLAANDANIASLKQHALIVCLWATPEAIWERVRHQTHRPLLQGPDPLGKIRTLLEQRTPFYRQADVLVHTGTRSVREVAQHVLHQFQIARARVPDGERTH